MRMPRRAPSFDNCDECYMSRHYTMGSDPSFISLTDTVREVPAKIFEDPQLPRRDLCTKAW